MPAAPAAQAEYGIRIRAAAWVALRKTADLTSDTALADALDVTSMTVYRVTTAAVDPSPKFIAHTLHAFPFVSFDRLFEVYRRSAAVRAA